MDRAAGSGIPPAQSRSSRNAASKAEFRNTHFSYTLGPEGVEQFVATPELHSDEAIESDPLPPGQVWAVSTGTREAGPGCIGSRSQRARWRRRGY